MSAFNINDYWQEEMRDHIATAQKASERLQNDFQKSLDICVNTIRSGNKIMFFGNGGSAADAQHLATELTVRFVKDRPSIAAIALTTDTSTLTAAGNDFGFDHVFSRQIDAIGNDGDVAIALSTSGTSPNIIKAIETAKSKNISTIGLSGRDGGKMPDLCDQMIIAPSNSTARIQEMHILLGHMICGGLEQSLGLVD
ncbi:MAG: D-sedoheptulose-7-phosphate isomerase [Alphaproteobacteria bacterium]